MPMKHGMEMDEDGGKKMGGGPCNALTDRDVTELFSVRLGSWSIFL